MIFIARQHNDARYWYSKSLCLTVCLSVRNVPVSDENGLTYFHSFFHHTVAQSFCFYKHQISSRNSDRVTPCRGAKYRWGIKISRFSTNKSLYLANDARYRHSYYGRQIINRTQAFDWHQFQWRWVASNPDFKVTIDIIQRQKTVKWYKMRAIFTMADQ